MDIPWKACGSCNTSGSGYSKHQTPKQLEPDVTIHNPSRIGANRLSWGNPGRDFSSGSQHQNRIAVKYQDFASWTYLLLWQLDFSLGRLTITNEISLCLALSLLQSINEF